MGDDMVDTGKTYTTEELAQALRSAAESGEAILVESDGQTYEVSVKPASVEQDIWADYDPAVQLEAWEGIRGIMQGVDVEAWIREMKEARGPRLSDLP